MKKEWSSFINFNWCLQAHEEVWQDCAKRLTEIMQQVIEFAKMIPGFRKFSQEDQIALLKTGLYINENSTSSLPQSVLSYFYK